MSPKTALKLFLAWVLVVTQLSSCSSMFKDEKQVEADKISLEHSRAQVFGASGVAFSPDGSQVAIGSRDIIWVVDTTNFETKARLSYVKASRFGGKKSLQFVDNHRLVIGADGAIWLWDLNERSITDHLKLNRFQHPRVVTWSSAAQLLAYSLDSTTGSVKLVPVGEGGFGSIINFQGFEGVPSDLVFSRDGQYLAATGDGQGVFVRHIESGVLAGELPTEGFADNLESFGENRLLVSGKHIALWTFLGEQDALEFENANLDSQVAGQVMVRVAGALALGTLTVLAAVTMAGAAAMGGTPPVGGTGIGEGLYATYAIATADVKTTQQPWCGRNTAVSPDGMWLVDVFPGITSEVVRVFNPGTGQLIETLNPRGEYSCAVEFSPDSKKLLVTTDKVARLYDTNSWNYHDLNLR